MVEAVEPFKLHITSMSYLYEVFEHLQLLCIDIWMHIHSVTTTDVSPDLGELAESLGDARVQTIPLCNGWGCRTFQTAYHIHVIPIWGVWAPSTVLCIDIWMHIYSVTTTDVSPDLGELAESQGDVRVQTIPLHNGWGCRTFQTAHHIYAIPIWGVWAPSTVVYRHMDAHSLRCQHRRFPIFGRVSRKSRWCKNANHTILQCLRWSNLSNCTSHLFHTYMRYLSTLNCFV
jgi:hypothetical protein